MTSAVLAANSDGTLLTDLLSVVGYGLVAGVGLTALFSFAIRGLVTASNARRDGERGAALAWTGIGVVAVVACLAVVGVGLVTMLSR